MCRQLNNALDRCRHRVVYFSHARHLGATALIRVLATWMRLPTRRSHSETLQGLVTALGEQPHQLLLWFDEAHELPDETLLEARALAESDLYDSCPVRILLIGLPLLRDRLQAIAPLWRRVVVREELTGLTFEELPFFIEYHFGTENLQRICQEAMRILFERARGIPGLVDTRGEQVRENTQAPTVLQCYSVRAMVRSPQKLLARPWAGHPDLDTLNFFNNWIGYMDSESRLKERKTYWFETKD